jgi:hypothetical protein
MADKPARSLADSTHHIGCCLQTKSSLAHAYDAAGPAGSLIQPQPHLLGSEAQLHQLM